MASAADDSPDLDVISVPAERLQALRQAANSHNMTRRRQVLGQFDDADAGQRQLAAQLRQLSQKYDFGGLIAVLQSVEEI